MKVLHDLDFVSGNLLKNFRLNLAAAPTVFGAGQLYFDTTLNKMLWRNATAWIDPLARVNHTGTQLASTVSDFADAAKDAAAASLAAGTHGGITFSYNAVTKALSGTGTVNLGATLSPTGITVTSSAGTSASLPLADGTNAGLLSPAEKTKLAGLTNAMVLKGNLEASASPNYPAGTAGDAYIVSVAGRVGGASGVLVDVGDMVIATATNAGGTQAAVGASWTVIEHNLAGVLLAANNLSDLANTATAWTNLNGNAQAIAAPLTGINTATAGTVSATDSILQAIGKLVANTAAKSGKFSALIGDGTSTLLTVTHNLNTLDVIVGLRDASTNELVSATPVAATVNTVTFQFSTAPTANAFRAIVMG